jgi:hypothetical protein
MWQHILLKKTFEIYLNMYTLGSLQMYHDVTMSWYEVNLKSSLYSIHAGSTALIMSRKTCLEKTYTFYKLIWYSWLCVCIYISEEKMYLTAYWNKLFNYHCIQMNSLLKYFSITHISWKPTFGVRKAIPKRFIMHGLQCILFIITIIIHQCNILFNNFWG